MPDDIARIAEAVSAGQDPGARLRIGVVTEVESATGRVRLSTTGTAWLSRDAGVDLAVGDRAYALLQKPVGIVVGRVGGGGGLPVGAVTPYAGTSAPLPAGWLLCDGAAVSRTTYATLFARLGTTYGGGNGSTTFNLPNLANRVPVGSGTRNRGTTGGADRVTLTTSELPKHNHGNVGSHTHTINDAGGTTSVASGTGATVANSNTATTSSNGSHTHLDVGADASHENMPPFAVLHYIIKVI